MDYSSLSNLRHHW